LRIGDHGREWARRGGLLLAVSGMACAAILAAAAADADQTANDTVGLIDGEDIAVTGPMSVEVVGGQVKTILRSGSDVRVKSGQARVSLVEGGQISICGPARLSILKSGEALTLALESGVVHARVEKEPSLTFYTAQIQGRVVAVGDEPSDVLVGFESPGMMCIRTYRGALHVEQQLSGQTVMVPQGVDVLLANGQIDLMRNGDGRCNCELQVAKGLAIPAHESGAAASAAGVTNEAAQNAGGAAFDEKPAAKEEPIYTVDMPPLRFDANAKVQPEPDPRLMVIVRRVRVRPTLIFQGRVEGEAVATAAAAPQPPPVVVAPANTAPPAQGSVVDRVRSFFHRLWSRGR
jgi:hypothetical protein